MKRLFLFLVFAPLFAVSQRIAENKVDEFTHNMVKRTTWDLLAYKFNGSMYAHTRISLINKDYFLQLRYLCRSGCAIGEGGRFMLKLDNDSIITLVSIKSEIACTGCGATGLVGAGVLGLDLSFTATEEQIRYVAVHRVVKARLYLSDGYVEASIGSGYAKNLGRQAELILK